MEFVPRNVPDEMVYALVKAHNLTRHAEATAGTKVHAAITSRGTGYYTDPTATALTVTAANGSDLATLRTLTQNLWDVVTAHLADDVAHLVADGTNVLTVSRPSDTAAIAAINLVLNNIKAKYTAHRGQSGVHPTDDSGHAISASDATDLSSGNTLGNELKTDINAHINDALAGYSIRVVSA